MNVFLEQSVINDILAMDICEGFETSFTTKWEDFKAQFNTGFFKKIAIFTCLQNPFQIIKDFYLCWTV